MTTKKNYIKPSFWNHQGKFGMSDDMTRICVTICFFAAGLTALISGLTHIQMDVMWVVPWIELTQFAIEVVLWLYARQTGRYRSVFPLQIVVAYIGMTFALLIGGSDFLTNIFWIALVSPFCLVTGYRKMGTILFATSILQMWWYYQLHGGGFSAQQDIFMLDAFLFTIATVAIVTVVKVWAERLQIQLAETQVSVIKLQKDKHRHLIQMNHELRNPLAAMVASIGALQELQRKEQSDLQVTHDDRARSIVETLHASSCHMLAVLNDVLEIDRMETGFAQKLSLSSFSIRQLVQEVSSMFTAMARGSDSVIHVRFAEGLEDQWNGPSKQIRQVLINLIANSIKHAPGTVICVSVLEHCGFLIFQISDGGPGLPSDAVRTFNAIDAAPSNENDVGGLGLKICKLMVEKQMGGTIQLQSSPKNGTVFVVKLPLSKCTENLSVERPTYGINQPTNQSINVVQECDLGNTLFGKQLLLAEDDQHLGQALASAFECAGLNVTLVTTSQDAMGAIEAGRTFDLALIDFDLGSCSHKDGIGLVQDLQNAGIKAVTGHTATYSQQLHTRWRQAGVNAIICKPANTEEIIRVMANCYLIAGQIQHKHHE